jgi:hypothetical protein
MLYREIIAVCSEIHTKHTNTLCGQNVEFVNVKPGGTYSNHWAAAGQHQSQHKHATSLFKHCTIQTRAVRAFTAVTVTGAPEANTAHCVTAHTVTNRKTSVVSLDSGSR